jgi:enolase
VAITGNSAWPPLGQIWLTVVMKQNQCGTLSAARDALDEARGAGYATVLSAHSGETEDSWLADLAVGVGMG